MLFRQELERLADHRSATVRFLVGRRSDLGWDPLSTAALAANIPGLRDHDVYLCGPPDMTSGVRTALIAREYLVRRCTPSLSNSDPGREQLLP